MSVKSNVESAELSIRKALINALAEGEDQHLCELFEMLMAVRDLKSQINNTIRFTDNTKHYRNRESEFNLDNIITFPTKHGGDLDAMDDITINPNDDEEG